MSPGATALDPAAGHADEGFLSPTGGFLPGPPPLSALPPDWAAWDTLANALPARVAAGEVAAAVAALPPFRAEALPAACRCRAASLLGILVHALAREQQLFGRPAGELPAALLAPWDEVCAALGRPGAGMTYSDLFLYNWRLRDPAGPCRLANLDVLIPVFGTREERVFNLVMVETHAVAAPLVGLVERMAAARAAGDHAALAAALAEVAAMLRRMTFDTLLQIDPNPFSREPVDHLVWAKTVAPFAAPVRPGELGLSGGGSPVFHALDALFGRRRFDSQIGRELVALRAWLPAAVRDFLARCASLELPTHVAAAGDRALTGAFRDAFDAYAGERGWLGIHRLKVYGFMEVGFRAGRTATNGGFAGEATARAWEALDATLAAAQQERHPEPAASCPFSAAARLRFAGSEPVALAPVVRVQLDATGEGLAPRPGDRLGVWPRHQPALVARTLDALGAHGHEPLRLTEEWRAALAARGEAVVDPLPLADFCRLARLRPLTRPIAKALLALHPAPALAALVERREEDHHELWEALALLAAAHYDPRRLWRAAPWQEESLARLVPPEPMRIYSLSSTPADGSASDGNSDASREPGPEQRSEVRLDLTVGALRYASASALDGEPIERRGAASHDLPATRSGPIAARLVRPSRFHLPDDPSQPVVMFAGGTGIAPFRAFWQARRGAAGATWLLAGVRDLDALAYRQELAAEVATHGLELRVVCSRTDVGLRGSGGVLAQVAAARGHVDRAITADAEALRTLLRPRAAGGGEAVVYVCGQTRFAHTVLAGLRHLLASPGSAVGDPLAALYGSGRLMLDVFTTAAAADAPSVRPFRLYDASEVIEHNRPDGDLWMVIDGLVYDVSELVGMHPGGADLLHANCGLDATRSWQAVRHHLEPEVAAMLDLYKIGKIRRLAFGPRWGTTIIPRRPGTRPATATAQAEGLVHLTLHDLYRAWIRYLYAVVELENTLAINARLGERAVVTLPTDGCRPPLLAALLLDAHRLWLDTYLPHLVGEGLLRVWYLTVGLAAPRRPLCELATTLAPVVACVTKQAELEVAACRQRLARQPSDATLVAHLEGKLADARRWLAGYKRHLCRGLLAFETHEAEVLARAGDALLAVLSAIPQQLRSLAD